MFTRRNWLLRCSILINIAVLLYICSHVMIGSSNFAFVIQEDYALKSPQSSALYRTNTANVALMQQSMDNLEKQTTQQQQRNEPQETARDSDPDSQLDNDSNQVSQKINFYFVFAVYLLSPPRLLSSNAIRMQFVSNFKPFYTKLYSKRSSNLFTVSILYSMFNWVVDRSEFFFFFSTHAVIASSIPPQC